MTLTSIHSSTSTLRRARALCGLILLATLGACSGTTYNAPTVHRPGPASTGYYGTRTPGDLAFGGPTGLTAPTQPIDSVELDRYLKEPVARAPQPSAHARTSVRKPDAARLAFLPEAKLPARDVAPVTAAQPQPAVPAAATPSAPMAAAPSSDAQRYAAREAQSSKQAQYRGGDVVVISVSTILIVLLIVLLILLLR